jgi:glycosyltransferase involved in cell wall biosynthesis
MEYHNRQHAGKAAQLNYALNLAESKYIGYLDDDDRVMPNHYEQLYNAAEKSGAEFVYSNVQPVVLNYNDDSIVEEWPVNDEDIEWNDIRLHNKINHSTILHTRSLAEKVGGYDERMQVLIDFDYIKRLASMAKPFHVRAVTYQWNLRRDESGQIKSISGLWYKSPDAAGRSLLAFFEKDPASLCTCYLEHGEIKYLKQQVENLENEHKRNIQLLSDLQVTCSAKRKKHLRTIRLLVWLNIVLTFLLVALVACMLS